MDSVVRVKNELVMLTINSVQSLFPFIVKVGQIIVPPDNL